jgi:hypothetical protein
VLSQALAAAENIPAGLADYTAAHDWPSALRTKMTFAFGSNFNLGLGLRWVAASTALDRYSRIAEPRQRLIKEQFVRLVQARIESIAGISLHADDEGDHLNSRAIVPFTITSSSGAFATFEESQNVHMLMREFGGGPVCHLGQAVRLGSRTVLRIAASAADICTVSERMAAGNTLHQAIEPVEAKLDVVFDKIAAVLQHARAL